jgi:hypothetical protein
MRDINPTSRLLGFVQLSVGGRVVAVPVQAVRLDRDGGEQPGGFYAEGSHCGIYVEERASEEDVAEQIRLASNDAMQHIAKKLLN